MPSRPADRDLRYTRQVAYSPFGRAGQQRLSRGRALIVGVGGLGCASADLLARSGVGFLRLVDDDRVSLANLHRQVLFDEADAAEQAPKVAAAARRIAAVNSGVRVEPIVDRLTCANAAALCEGIDVIVDGTDNFADRFIINDLAVQRGLPWIFAGVVAAEAQVMTIVPGQTPCLRCVFHEPPPPCVEPTCTAAGVLGPAVTAVASLQAMEAIKLLAGAGDRISRHLTKLDLWTGQMQRIDVARSAAEVDCPACKRRDFEFLYPCD